MNSLSKIWNDIKKVFSTANSHQEQSSPSLHWHTPATSPRKSFVTSPAFRVLRIQHPYTPGSFSSHLKVPLQWGDLVKRPPSITIFHNQQKCVVCGEFIDITYRNKGWARCPTTRKLVHGYCYDAWVETKGVGCPVCESAKHSMKKISYPTDPATRK